MNNCFLFLVSVKVSTVGKKRIKYFLFKFFSLFYIITHLCTLKIIKFFSLPKLIFDGLKVLETLKFKQSVGGVD